jgi:hypothetical protein
LGDHAQEIELGADLAATNTDGLFAGDFNRREIGGGVMPSAVRMASKSFGKTIGIGIDPGPLLLSGVVWFWF